MNIRDIESMMNSISSFFDEDTVVKCHWFRDKNQITYKKQKEFRNRAGMCNQTIQYLRDNEMYSFELLDGSLVQIFYEFNAADVLVAATLSFFKYERQYEKFDYGNCLAYDVEANMEYDLCPYTSCYPNSWIRLDFSSIKFGVVHNDVHLHSNLMKDCRIPVTSIPTPQLFIETILVWFYSDSYKKKYLNIDTGKYLADNNERLESIKKIKLNYDSDFEKTILHLTI